MPAFPFAEYWWFYASFTAVVCVLLGVDLWLHRRPEPIGFRSALAWTVVWFSIALAFGGGLYLFASDKVGPDAARRLGLEFLAALVVEESLSVDNMFVFALVFRYFAIPGELHHRILFYGVLGAFVARAVFIAIGVAITRFHFVLVVMGLFLIYTGVRIALQRDEAVHPGDNPVVRLARKLFPVTRELHGNRFFVMRDGVRHATPLFLVLLVLESTDVVFAIDSVPAVLAVTSEPLVVYTSNVLAILGLRSLYFVLSGALERFYTLKYALAAILVFVGLKMAWLDEALGDRVPIGISLAVIFAALAIAIVIAIAVPYRARPDVEQHARAAEEEEVVGRVSPTIVTGLICILLAVTSVFLALGKVNGVVEEAFFRAGHPATSALISGGVWFVVGIGLILTGMRQVNLKPAWNQVRRWLAGLLTRQQS